MKSLKTDTYSFFKNKKVLITGANGFKGSWLSYWLYLFDTEVFGLGIKNENEKLFKDLNLKKKINFTYLDITNKIKLKKFLLKKKPEIIFHLAAQPIISEGYNFPYKTIMTNSIGTLNILENCRNIKFVKSLILITSDKCYKDNFSTKGFVESDKMGGEDPYSSSKACAELLAECYTESFYKKNKIGIATCRAGNVIGGGDWSSNRLIPDCIKWINKNKEIYIRNPNHNRPWQHVLEPLSGYILLAKKLHKNYNKYSGPWNFGPKQNTVTSVLQVVKEIVKKLKKGKVRINKKNFFYEQKNLQLNIKKSNKELGWYPIYSIAKSISITVDWYKGVVIDKKVSAEEMTKKQILDYINDKKI